MTAVQIMPGGEGGSYVATVRGTTLKVDAYAAEPGDNGQVLVSLVIAADQVSIGVLPARHAEPSQPAQRNEPTRVWGDPTVPDPRANIPGAWQPPPSAADAGRGHSGEHRLVGETTRILKNLFRARRLA